MTLKRRFLSQVIVLGGLWFLANPPSITEAADSFAQRSHDQLHRRFITTMAWWKKHPQPYSHDAVDALEWLLKNAIEQGWSAELAPALDRDNLKQNIHPLLWKKVKQVKILALAANEKSEQSLQQFIDHLKTVRIRQPNDTLSLAYALSAQFQINGDYAAAREVYRRTIDAFFLNEQVRTLCERRQAKLLLAGETAPDFTAGEQSLKDLRGKYVLVDFWATNCAPCLMDLPHLREVSRRFSGDQFQILGISFDTDADFVSEFKQRYRIDWPTPLLENSSQNVRDQYRVVTIPSTFVIDPEGKIVLVDGQARDVALFLKKHLQQK